MLVCVQILLVCLKIVVVCVLWARKACLCAIFRPERPHIATCSAVFPFLVLVELLFSFCGP